MQCDGCWIFQHSAKSAYGGVGNTIVGRYFKVSKAHQLSYVVYKGDYNRSSYICHKCDVPSCVNPDHLFEGTPRENTQDMIRKGRRGYTGMPGSRHHKSKLTELEVRFIKCSKGFISNIELARLFNVNPRTISSIRCGINWNFDN